MKVKVHFVYLVVKFQISLLKFFLLQLPFPYVRIWKHYVISLHNRKGAT